MAFASHDHLSGSVWTPVDHIFRVGVDLEQEKKISRAGASLGISER